MKMSRPLGPGIGFFFAAMVDVNKIMSPTGIKARQKEVTILDIETLFLPVIVAD
jgi:hypothetical protein